MKRKSFKLISLVLAMVIIMSLKISAFATDDENINIAYDRASGEIVVSGNAPLAVNPDEPVRLVILKPDTNLSDWAEGKLSFVNVGVHVDETVLSEDKTFEFKKVTFPESIKSGDYIVLVAVENELYESVLSYATKEQAIEKLSNAKNAEEVLEAFSKYNDVYGLETGKDSLWESLSETGKATVLSNMVKEDFETPEEISEAFNLYIQLYRIYEGPWGVVKEIIEADYEKLGLDLSDYNELGNLKTDVCKNMMGTLSNDKASLKELFDDAVKNAKKNQSSSSRPSGGSSQKGSSSNVSMQVKVPEEEKEPTSTDAPIEVLDNPFIDLSNHEWAKESILKLYEEGIVNGKSENEFKPDDNITRAEAVKMIVLTFGEIDKDATCNFADVTENMWSYSYIATAVLNGYATGYDDETFGASDKITREDFATMILRAAEKNGYSFKEEADAFADDAEISDYAKGAVYKLKNENIIGGMGENTFAPKNPATRAQAAKIMAEFLD